MNDLSFITDADLRKTLEDSIEYIYSLHEQSKFDKQQPLYQQETRRVIILYIVSVIEGLLLFSYKLQSEKLTRIEYKDVCQLPELYRHKTKSNFPVVIAVREEVMRNDFEIGLRDLIGLFKRRKFISERLSEDLLDINNLRNTFHLTKQRTQNCDTINVEKALTLLVEILEITPGWLTP